MIPPIKKIPVLLLAVILSLSLCNTLTVFATRSIPNPVSSLQSGKEATISTSSTAELPVDREKPKQEPSAGGEGAEVVPPEQEPTDISTPSDAGPPVDNGTEEVLDATASPTNSILLDDDIIWKEAATIDELESLLKDEDWVNAGGHIRVTDDLIIPADEYCIIWPRTTEDMPLVVDLGAHTLYVQGWLRSFGNTKYIGDGGENGLIHIKTGGKANIRSAVFSVMEEGGYAIWQEEGSILSYEPIACSVGKIRFAETLEGEVSTFEELMLLLEDEYWKANGGQITVTDNLVVPVGEEHQIGWLHSKALTTLDMGKYTLFVEGELGIYEKVKLIGKGGENGLLRVRTGGEMAVQSAALIAEEGGYAIWQEEGSLLEYSPNEHTVGKVHFAQRPVAVPFSYISPDIGIPVAVIYDGQTLEDVLPETDSVRLYWRGVMDQGTTDKDKLIPVAWDLEPYREQLCAGERVLITGNYPETEAFQPPVCLVVFQNGNPAIFLNGHGAEARGQPVAIVNVELVKPELGGRFEWSQDGETWLPAEFTRIPNGDGPLRFKVSFPQEEPPAYPYYLSVVVDYPDGSVGYSDVIVFTEAEKECGSGGNRGGGTDITAPPIISEPEHPDNPELNPTPSQPETTLPPIIGPSENSDITPKPAPEHSGQPDITPPEGVLSNLEVASESKPTIPSVEEIPLIGQTAPSAKAESDLHVPSQIAYEMDVETSNFKLDDTAEGISEPVNLMPSSPARAMVTVGAVMSQPDNEGGKTLAKAVPIAIGGIATATVIGAAGVYHSESLRKRLWAALKKLIRIKK